MYYPDSPDTFLVKLIQDKRLENILAEKKPQNFNKRSLNRCRPATFA